MDQPAPYSDTSIAATPDEFFVPADGGAVRLTPVDAVVRRLGGWHLARYHEVASPAGTVPGSHDPGWHDEASATALYWTDRAVVACDRLRGLIVHLDVAAERRLTAMIVRAMVHLIVDGYPCASPRGDVPLRPGLSLHLRLSAAGIVVVDLGATAQVT